MIVKTRSQTNFLIVFSMKGSVLPVIWPRILFTVVLSVVVTVFHGFLSRHRIDLTPTPFTLIGLTLAIFLGFRNGVSYERFWEGRTLWGELIMVSRTLARQTLASGTGLAPEEQKAQIYRLIAFARCLRDYLRRKESPDFLDDLLSPEEAREIAAAPNRPYALIMKIGAWYAQKFHEGHFDPVVFSFIDQEVGTLTRILSGCERIQSTPIPYAFLLMLHRTVHIYCVLLPFGIIDTVGLFTPLVVAVVSYTFFGLDALGDQIEDPFDTLPNDLPLDAMTRNIEINMRAALGEKDLPPQIEPVNSLLL